MSEFYYKKQWFFKGSIEKFIDHRLTDGLTDNRAEVLEDKTLNGNRIVKRKLKKEINVPEILKKLTKFNKI